MYKNISKSIIFFRSISSHIKWDFSGKVSIIWNDKKVSFSDTQMIRKSHFLLKCQFGTPQTKKRKGTRRKRHTCRTRWTKKTVELSARFFYDELSLSTRIRGTQTQHKNGDIVFMKLEENLSTIYFSRPYWPSTLIKYLKTCVVLTCTLKFMHLLIQHPTSPQSSSLICVRVLVPVLGVVGTVEKVFFISMLPLTEGLYTRFLTRFLTMIETMSVWVSFTTSPVLPHFDTSCLSYQGQSDVIHIDHRWFHPTPKKKNFSNLHKRLVCT